MNSSLSEVLTIADLFDAFSYDPWSGLIVWKSREWIHSGVNKLVAGKVAGSITKEGYVDVSLTVRGKRHRIRGHKIAWAMSTGGWPDDEIDHKDGIPSNNRISNLRIATHSQNMANRHSYGKSKIKGVRQDRRTGRWQALITVNKKQTHLGMFDDPSEARAAYLMAARKSHGEFSRI